MAQAKSLTETEVKRVLAVIAQGRHAARNRAMVLLTFYAGMRVGEVSALLWRDVVNQDGLIKSEIKLKPEQTKGKHARTVMLGEKLQKELATYAGSMQRIVETKPFIYSQRVRNGFTPNTLSQEFKTIYNKAGIDGASSHSGRRTFITKLAQKGVSVRVLMALAGHRSIATTQRYIDINDEMQRVAVELI